jgi:hypothetical protein
MIFCATPSVADTTRRRPQLWAVKGNRRKRIEKFANGISSVGAEKCCVARKGVRDRCCWDQDRMATSFWRRNRVLSPLHRVEEEYTLCDWLPILCGARQSAMQETMASCSKSAPEAKLNHPNWFPVEPHVCIATRQRPRGTRLLDQRLFALPAHNSLTYLLDIS